MSDAKDWLVQRAKEKERLYEKYGKGLEKEHTGEYAAITPTGETIIGKRAGEVMQKAVDNFGERNFGLFRIGHLTFARWRRINYSAHQVPIPT